LVALTLGGCSAASHPAQTASHRTLSGPVADCLTSEPQIRAANVGILRVQVLGSGTRAVVISEQSGEDLCAWKPYARSLVSRGYEVVLYDYIGPEDKNAAALTTWIRGQGATKVALLGGSEGAKASIVAGAALPDPPDAVVALSPEQVLNGDDVAPSAAKLRCPTLLVTADHDPYGSAEATANFQAVAPKGLSSRLVVAGTDHGIQLLDHSDVDARVLAFLRAHLG
jgi:pimeloyl-ACP methyl ester carboxylesterase